MQGDWLIGQQGSRKHRQGRVLVSRGYDLPFQGDSTFDDEFLQRNLLRMARADCMLVLRFRQD
jgi:hypothetical protein